MLKDLVTYIVKGLVAFPNDVHIGIKDTSDTYTIEIKVNDQDRGRLIGKEGRTIKAIRGLAIVLVPESKKISIDIAE